MQHLDEGRIQAWLDRDRSGLGEAELEEIQRHLSACPTCAAIAVELERLEVRSVDLLSAEGMHVEDVPAYENVVARSRTVVDPGTVLPDAPHRRSAAGIGARTSVAWAASIAVALGIGWALNDALGPGSEDGGPQRPTAAVSPTASAEPAPRVADGESRAARRRTPSGSDAAASPESAEAEALTAAAGAPLTSAEAGDAAEGLETQPALPAAELVAAAPEFDTIVGAEARSADAATPAPAPPEALRVEATTNVGPGESIRTQGATGIEVASDVPAAAMVRGRVTDEAGTPLPGAQIYIPGTSIGTLSGPDGRFAIALGESAPAFASGGLTLTAERIGYSPVTRALPAEEALSSPVDIALGEQALSLDQVVITGRTRALAPDRPAAITARQDAAGSTAGPLDLRDPDVWTEGTRADAEAAVGFTLATLPDRPIDGIHVASKDGVPVARVDQRLADGTRITLIETRSALDDAIVAEDARRASVTRDGVTILILGTVPRERLEAILQQVR